MKMMRSAVMCIRSDRWAARREGAGKMARGGRGAPTRVYEYRSVVVTVRFVIREAMLITVADSGRK